MFVIYKKDSSLGGLIGWVRRSEIEISRHRTKIAAEDELERLRHNQWKINNDVVPGRIPRNDVHFKLEIE